MSEFWENKSVCVTGGAGFLGKVVTRKLKERGTKSTFVPTIEEYDLVDPVSIDKMLADFKTGYHHPSGGSCRWYWCKPGTSG